MILYTGRLSGEKSLPVLIQAMPYVHAALDCHLLLAGVGREKENLEALVKKLNLQKKTTFVGGLSRQDLPKIYNLGTLFAIPSTAELQSIVTMEAMASGLPVVAVNAGALPELCHDGENGYLHAVGDSRDMAEKIIKILKNPTLAKAMGQKSRDIVRQHSFDEVIKVFEGVYHQVLGK
jgi:glycosyltransferase involved in cell wall biosynthesis